MIVYKITNILYGTSYIGQTVLPLEVRWARHISDAIGGRKKGPFKSAVKSYGSENFRAEVLVECQSKEEMDFCETLFIQVFNTKHPNGYNLTDGGEGTLGHKHSEATCRFLSEYGKGKDNHQKGLKRTPEQKQRMSEAQVKNALTNPGNTGHRHTDETKQILRAAHLGLKHTEEAKRNMRGKKRTPEHLQKMAEGRRLAFAARSAV